MAFGEEEVISRFSSHSTTEDTKPIHTKLRSLFIELGMELDFLLPDGRDKSLSFTHLEDAAMRAHRALSHPNPISKD